MSKKTHLNRKMETRHIRMISLGGVIGTGLFLSSGYTIHQAGPIGTIIAYLIGALIVYSVMLCLGELSVAMPYTGAFHVYAKKYIGEGTRLYCRNLILVNLDDCSRFRIYSCWTYHARVVSSYPSLDLEYYFYYINILFQCLFG